MSPWSPSTRGLGTGTFTATGDGLCPSGTVDVVGGMIAGWRSGTIANFLVIQQFTCDDGSGSFLVRIYDGPGGITDYLAGQVY